MKHIYIILLLFLLSNCCVNGKYKTPKSLYKSLDVDIKYTNLICNAMQDFAKSDVFHHDLIFEVHVLKEEIETSDIVIEIYSMGDSYKELHMDSIYTIITHPLSLYRIGHYKRNVPNRYWQLGERIILWNDQDTSHKITPDLCYIIEKYISLSKERIDTTKTFYSVSVMYYFKKNSVDFYKKTEHIYLDKIF